MRVAVFGLGYVGTVTAACLATNGHDFWGVGPESAKVDLVATGTSPVIEPDLGRLVAHAVEAGSLHALTNPAEAVDRQTFPSSASARHRRLMAARSSPTSPGR